MPLTQNEMLRRRRGELWYAMAQAALGPQQLSEIVTVAAAASTDTTIQMPAGATILGVVTNVLTAVTCTSTFKVGDSGDDDRFGGAVSKVAGTTYRSTVAPYVNASALAVTITPDTAPSSDAGRVQIVIIYTN